MSKATDRAEAREDAREEAREAARETAAPGKALITFHEVYNGMDFGGESRRYHPGDTVEVDAAMAKKLSHDMGAECPFKIGTQNKAIGRSPETK